MTWPNIQHVENFIQHPGKQRVEDTDQAKENKFLHHLGSAPAKPLHFFEQKPSPQQFLTAQENSSIQIP